MLFFNEPYPDVTSRATHNTKGAPVALAEQWQAFSFMTEWWN